MDVLLPSKKRYFGQLQEQIAAEYLTARGLELLFTNFQCRLGEIDLIMQDNNTLVFVEVRYRRSAKFGSAVESVDRRKQNRLLRCAQYFLISHNPGDRLPCRFDIIGLSPGLNPKNDRPSSAAVEPHVEWLKNAFGN
jgi:putative endonuclease